MATKTGYVNSADAPHPGVNDGILQSAPIVIEVPQALPDDDDVKLTLPVGFSGRAPRVQVDRHTGGDVTCTAAATYVVSDGDTIKLQLDADGNGVYTEVTHTIAGVSAGAATAAELAASINADAALAPYILAVAGLTSNALTLFPLKPRSKFYVSGGTQTGISFAGTVTSQLNRTYVSQVPALASGTGWSYSYVASTRVLTVKNETGGAVNRVQIQVWP